MPAFLLKTEPSAYSFADLVRDARTCWSGVSNPGALISLRAIARGDELFIYHTGDEKAIVGLARAASGAYEDPARTGLTDEGLPRFAVVDVEPVRALARPVTLASIKADARFKGFALVTNSRLSVMPVPAALARAIRAMGGK